MTPDTDDGSNMIAKAILKAAERQIKPKPDYSQLIGKPYVDMGRGPDGYDCWGAVLAVGAMHGISIPDYGHGVSCADELRMVRAFASHRSEWQELPPTIRPIVGDVILFRQTSGGLHWAIVIEDGYFIQCTADLGVHAGRLDHPYYRSLIQAFYRQI